jgi:aminoglycoside phosphotransferase (APT) family kinase protein
LGGDAAPALRPTDALLVAAGLQPEATFRRAFSYSNDVWIGDAVVLRVARESEPWTLGHEQEVLSWLPDAVPHPRIVANGEHDGRAWIVVQRVHGQELGRAWPAMTLQHRRDVIHQLGAAMHVLHRVATPIGWQRPDLEPAVLARLRTPEEIAAAFQAPPQRIWALGEAARTLPFVDVGLVDAAVQLVVQRLPLFADDPRRLVHTDLHWDNLMTDGVSLTAILDFERARPAPADLDLDVLLRFSHWPHLPVAPDYEASLHAADFRQVPTWLEESYPELFVAPHLRERLEVYAIMHDLRQGIQFPERPGDTKPPTSPWNRLRATLSGDSYFAAWL